MRAPSPGRDRAQFAIATTQGGEWDVARQRSALLTPRDDETEI